MAFLPYNLIMEGTGDRRYTSPPRETHVSSALLFLSNKGRVSGLNSIERLVAAGIDRESAGEAVCWFLAQGDENKLERYVSECENRCRERTDRAYA